MFCLCVGRGGVVQGTGAINVSCSVLHFSFVWVCLCVLVNVCVCERVCACVRACAYACVFARASSDARYAAYSYGKIDPVIWQKRPIHMAKDVRLCRVRGRSTWPDLAAFTRI